MSISLTQSPQNTANTLVKDETTSWLQSLLQNCIDSDSSQTQTSADTLHFDVHYDLQLNDETINISKLINKVITISWQHNIYCKKCLKRSNKSYGQGYCYVCFSQSSACDICMMQPHTCHFHQGTCREPAWAESVCFNDHIVYLTYTSDIKVGITRTSQVPTRWLDQGALVALPIIKTNSRRVAGMIEKYLSDYFSDKTNWRTMLKTAFLAMDYAELSKLLIQTKAQIQNDHADTIDAHLKQIDYIETDHSETDHSETVNSKPINSKAGNSKAVSDLQNAKKVTDNYSWLDSFPVLEFSYPRAGHVVQNKNTPLKSIPINSLNLDKTPTITGKLLAIKGQYLIFGIGVINLRKYTSYQLEVRF